MEDQKNIIIESPQPLQEVDKKFYITGWVPISWFRKTEFGIDNLLGLDFINIKGQTFIGSSVRINLGSDSESQNKIRLKIVVSFEEHTCRIISQSFGRINIEFSGCNKGQKYYLPLIVKDFVSPVDEKTIADHKDIEQLIKRNKRDYDVYTFESLRMREACVYKFRPGNEIKNNVKIDVYDDILSSETGLISQPLESLDIEITDHAKIDKLQNILNDKYREAIEWQGACGGGMDLIPYLPYCASTITLWILGHLFSDIDDLAWDKLREIVTKTFVLVKSSLSDKGVALTIVKNTGQEIIIFVFDKTFIFSDIDEAFSNIEISLADIDKKGPFADSCSPVVYEYNKTSKVWEYKPDYWESQG